MTRSQSSTGKPACPSIPVSRVGSPASADSDTTRITALKEGDLDGLTNLWYLTFEGQGLKGLPEGIFDDLGSLTDLSFSLNLFRTLGEGVFDSLENLEDLDLSGNLLVGLPEGVFDELGELSALLLDYNRLAELPEDVFDGLGSLSVLWMDYNGLAELPEGVFDELGDLLQLTLTGNDLTELSEVAISAGDTASRSVTASAVASAAHSLAIDSIWDNRSWFDDDNYLGFEFVIGAPLVLANPDEVKVEVPAVYLTQGAQSLDGGVPLVAGRQALLRVFATADADNDFDPRARATFYVGDATVYVDLTPPAVIPRAVDESRMDGSFTGVVPATAMQPGVEMVVELDRTDVIPETDGSQLRIPATGRMALDVVALETFDLKIVPIAFGSDVTGRNDKVASLAEDLAGDDSRGALPPTRTLLPIAEMDVTARDRYVTWADTLQDGIVALPDELRLLRHAEAGGTDTCYHGIFAVPATHYPDYWDVILGVAYIAAWSGLSLSHDVDGQYRPDFPATFAHELGHNLGLRHAPCGGPSGVDPRYPYSNGSIGVWGYAFASGGVPGRLLNPEGYRDLMSYCGPEGVSDFNFTLALDYRDAIAAPALARRPAAAPKTLLLWGSIRDGRLRL